MCHQLIVIYAMDVVITCCCITVCCCHLPITYFLVYWVIILDLIQITLKIVIYNCILLWLLTDLFIIIKENSWWGWIISWFVICKVFVAYCTALALPMLMWLHCFCWLIDAIFLLLLAAATIIACHTALCCHQGYASQLLLLVRKILLSSCCIVQHTGLSPLAPLHQSIADADASPLLWMVIALSLFNVATAIGCSQNCTMVNVDPTSTVDLSPVTGCLCVSSCCFSCCHCLLHHITVLPMATPSPLSLMVDCHNWLIASFDIFPIH